MSYVEKQKDGCWLWTGYKNPDGYGDFWNGKKSQRAHRWALSQKEKPPNEKLFACHHCDNPSCVNPSHLFWGTHSDNMYDAGSKGRIWGQKNRKKARAHLDRIRPHLTGEHLPHARFKTEAQVISVLKRLSKGESTRAIAADLKIAQCSIMSIKLGRNAIARRLKAREALAKLKGEV